MPEQQTTTAAALRDEDLVRLEANGWRARHTRRGFVAWRHPRLGLVFHQPLHADPRGSGWYALEHENDERDRVGPLDTVWDAVSHLEAARA